jgi:hypothetical protein
LEGNPSVNSPKGVEPVQRSLISIVAVLLAVGVLSSTAAADSASGVAPGGALSVSVSYPDVIVAGTTASASESVTNNSGFARTFTLTNTLTVPNGTTFTQTQSVTVAAGATFTQTLSRKTNRSDVGAYTLTLTATDGSETASATAHFTVVKR